VGFTSTSSPTDCLLSQRIRNRTGTTLAGSCPVTVYSPPALALPLLGKDAPPQFHFYMTTLLA
jgi:hypothetical protein